MYNNHIFMKDFSKLLFPNSLSFFSSSTIFLYVIATPYTRLDFVQNDWNKIRWNIGGIEIPRALFVVRLISRRWHRAVVSPVPCSGSLPKARSIVHPGIGNTHPYNRRNARPNASAAEIAESGLSESCPLQNFTGIN